MSARTAIAPYSNALAGLLRLFLLLCPLLMISPSVSAAHRLSLFATAEGNSISGRVYFTLSAPYKGEVLLFAQGASSAIVKVTSDDEGRFLFEGVKAGRYRVECRSIDGHLAEARVTVGVLQGGDKKGEAKLPMTGAEKSEAVDVNLLRQAVATELRPLKEQINKLEETLWFTQMIGGLGLLTGMFGIWMFFLARKSGSKRRPS
ncbi:MAG: hypothetical protein DHS20C08_17150 [Rhodomicrobium sp.]|nr:MAG: hypothetical protein DHS20C08_17150 [Rhodomicrobium sp.]